MQDELPSKAIASNGRTGDEVSKATAGKVVAKHWYKCIRRLLPAQIKVTLTGATGCKVVANAVKVVANAGNRVRKCQVEYRPQISGNACNQWITGVDFRYFKRFSKTA